MIISVPLPYNSKYSNLMMSYSTEPHTHVRVDDNDEDQSQQAKRKDISEVPNIHVRGI